VAGAGEQWCSENPPELQAVIMQFVNAPAGVDAVIMHGVYAGTCTPAVIMHRVVASGRGNAVIMHAVYAWDTARISRWSHRRTQPA
jgi:hypothetical protein